MQVSKRTEIIDIDKIIPYIGNARTHSKEQINKIRASFREFGVISALVVDDNYNLLVGHGRLEAARIEGIKQLNCIVVDHLTEAQKKAYIIADNRLAEDAGWDNELLAVELEGLKELDFDIDLIGFDEAQLNMILGSDDAEEDDFDVDEALKEPTMSQQGDLWLLGRHRLLCGDSTKSETYKTLMDGKKANLVVTDPPYGVAYDGSQGTIKNDNLKDEEFYHFLLSAFKNMESVMADDASIYVFHADTKGLIFRKAFEDAGFYLSGVCQWVKQSLVLGRSPYQWKNEPCLFGWKKKGKHKWYAGRKETTIWEFDKPTKSKLHSTMKPIPLMAYPIKNSTVVNGIVVDPFSGSASTIMACEQTDRIGYAIELEERFVDVGVKRYIESVGSDEDVYLIRAGEKIKYADIPREGCD